MRFIKINPFGVYVAPISVMMVAAWVVTIGLRRSPPVLVFCAMFWPEVTKRLDLAHKRTNRELRRPCERYRARP